MPPSRTSDSKKVKERSILAARVAKSGIEMFPCAYCEGALCKCYVSVDSKSKCCSEYVKRSLKCNIEGPSVSDWASLEHAEDEVLHKLAQTTSELYKLLARQSCLIKQQGFFKTRAKEILCRGLDLLDKLEAQEEKEKKEGELPAVMQPASVTAEQPNNLSSEELFVFESSF
jgi:hypothetical protein